MSNNTDNRESQSRSWFTAGAWGLAAAAVVGGTAYLLRGSSKKKEEEQKHAPQRVSQRSRNEPVNQSQSSDSSVTSYLQDMVARVILADEPSGSSSSRYSHSSSGPGNPMITNLNSLLNDIYVRALKLQTFNMHYRVFDAVFYDLHNKMKEVDPYYRKYSSTVQFAGSHYDKLRIKKPDEFDMDIVIRLPLDIKPNLLNPADSDIILEPKFAGFVQLKMGKQFQQLPMRDEGEWLNNRAAYEWMDGSHYLLRSKFTQWFQSVMTRALGLYKTKNQNRPVVEVDGQLYTIEVSKSGPATTLRIRDLARNFNMDVDLVPALKFPEHRWPICKQYTSIPSKCRKGYFMVVPKPNKDSPSKHDQNRSWRIALHNQERELLYNSNNLKQTIRLIKALRDAQGMKKIASYYIKTLFFWEISEIDDDVYWRNSIALLFKRMVEKFHEALVEGNIPYFWNKKNNLIGNVPRQTLTAYAKKLESLMAILQDPSKYKLVAKYLLSPDEFKEYNANILHI